MCGTAQRAVGLALGILAVVGTPCMAGAGTTQPRLAVLEFDAPADFSPSERELLGEKARQAVLQSLPPDQFLLMTRESIDAIARDMGKVCSEGECEVDTLRTVGADYGISGRVLSVNNAWVLTVKIHEANSGRVLAIEDGVATVRSELTPLAAKLTQRAVLSGMRQFVITVPETAAQRASGLLSVTTFPEGEAFLEGRPVGRTPLVRTRLPPGEHALVVAAEGYSTLSETVTIRAGQEVAISRALTIAAGYLTFDVRPATSSIFVDGALVPSGKQGPFPAGTRRIKIEAPGHLSEELRVEVGDKTSTPVAIKLRALPGLLLLRSAVEARCVVAGTEVRITPKSPQSLDMPAGDASFVCRRADNAEPVEIHASLPPGGSVSVEVRFPPRVQRGSALSSRAPRTHTEPARRTPALALAGAASTVGGILALVAATVGTLAAVVLGGDTLIYGAQAVHVVPPTGVVLANLLLIVGGVAFAVFGLASVAAGGLLIGLMVVP